MSEVPASTEEDRAVVFLERIERHDYPQYQKDGLRPWVKEGTTVLRLDGTYDTDWLDYEARHVTRYRTAIEAQARARLAAIPGLLTVLQDSLKEHNEFTAEIQQKADTDYYKAKPGFTEEFDRKLKEREQEAGALRVLLAALTA